MMTTTHYCDVYYDIKDNKDFGEDYRYVKDVMRHYGVIPTS